MAVLVLACLQVQLTHTHTHRTSSAVLLRQGAGLILPTAAVGEGQGQLFRSHAPEARSPAWYRWRGAGGGAYYLYSCHSMVYEGEATLLL